MSEENAQKKNKFRPVVFGCLIPSAGFLVLAIIAALLLSRAEPPGKKPEYIKSAEGNSERDLHAPSVSVAHASAKAWKLGFNLHAKSSGLAKVEF